MTVGWKIHWLMSYYSVEDFSNEWDPSTPTLMKEVCEPQKGQYWKLYWSPPTRVFWSPPSAFQLVHLIDCIISANYCDIVLFFLKLLTLSCYLSVWMRFFFAPKWNLFDSFWLLEDHRVTATPMSVIFLWFMGWSC